MKKTLIIGGSGFIGSRLIDILDKSYIINFDKNKSFSHDNITFIGNILNKDDLEEIFKKNIDQVILLAAEHRDDVNPTSLYYDVNVQGTQNVLDIMSKNEINKILFTSSVAVYGLNKKNPDETHPLEPFHDYGKSKMMAEELILEWCKENKKHCATIIRPVVVFGEENRGNVYNLFKQINKKFFLMIGSGNNKKSMAYVGNLASFIKNRMKSGKGYEIYNYADKPDLSMNELVLLCEKSLNFKVPRIKVPYLFGMTSAFIIKIIFLMFGKKSSINPLRVKKFCATTQFDSSKAFSTKFSPPFTLKESIRKTLNNEFKS